jgi:Uma2 family endonuclease
MHVATAASEREIIYPESDGQPMADNTKQFRWIVAIEGNLEAIFFDRPDVFVAGDLLWYPVEGHPEIRRAPDAMVAFGRPRGDRGSYLQWREEGIAPQVVFEVLSPGNTLREMGQKLQFYDRYGVEEYYLYDPDTNDLSGWQRNAGRLDIIEDLQGWVSPRLGIRFETLSQELQIFRPDGQPFLTFGELEQARAAAEAQTRAAEAQTRAAEAQTRAAEAQTRVAEARAQRLEEQLRAFGIEPDIAV